MRNAEVRKMPSELWSKGRVVVVLDFLDSERKMLTNLAPDTMPAKYFEQHGRGRNLCVIVPLKIKAGSQSA
jgi:hypothetical protein